MGVMTNVENPMINYREAEMDYISCDGCEERIYDGDSFYYVDGMCYCSECIRNMRRTYNSEREEF